MPPGWHAVTAEVDREGGPAPEEPGEAEEPGEPEDMKLDFQCVWTPSTRGFMSFQRIRAMWSAVLTVTG
jgi:hypothetical protein